MFLNSHPVFSVIILLSVISPSLVSPQAPKEALAQSVLAEVPNQLVSYFKMRNMAPVNPPSPVKQTPVGRMNCRLLKEIGVSQNWYGSPLEGTIALLKEDFHQSSFSVLHIFLLLSKMVIPYIILFQLENFLYKCLFFNRSISLYYSIYFCIIVHEYRCLGFLSQYLKSLLGLALLFDVVVCHINWECCCFCDLVFVRRKKKLNDSNRIQSLCCN